MLLHFNLPLSVGSRYWIFHWYRADEYNIIVYCNEVIHEENIKFWGHR